MSWILVLILYGTGGAPFAVYFDHQESCQDAKRTILKEHSGAFGPKPYAECFRK